MSPIEKWFGGVKQVGHEIVGLPGSISAWNLHSLSCNFHAIAKAIFDWSDLATIVFGHVRLHNLVIGVLFLSNGSIDVAQALGGHKIEFCFTLSSSIRRD